MSKIAKFFIELSCYDIYRSMKRRLRRFANLDSHLDESHDSIPVEESENGPGSDDARIAHRHIFNPYPTTSVAETYYRQLMAQQAAAAVIYGGFRVRNYENRVDWGYLLSTHYHESPEVRANALRQNTPNIAYCGDQCRISHQNNSNGQQGCGVRFTIGDGRVVSCGQEIS